MKLWFTKVDVVEDITITSQRYADYQILHGMDTLPALGERLISPILTLRHGARLADSGALASWGIREGCEKSLDGAIPTRTLEYVDASKAHLVHSNSSK